MYCLTDDSIAPLPGVTYAPLGFYAGPSYDVTKPPKYFFTFRGGITTQGNQFVREHLHQIYKDFNRQDVVMEFFDRHASYKNPEAYNRLMDTAYALVPHGDQRWNFRFSEVIGACAIPVLIADGLTLPYSQLIDWGHASVRLSEAAVDKALNETISAALEVEDGLNSRLIRLLANPHALLEQLPSDPKRIQAMRENICRINKAYFATNQARLDALLQSALVITHQGHGR